MKYIVPLSNKPTKQEMFWAWRFTVIATAQAHCQNCGSAGRLDACHVKARAEAPELQFEPSNGIALCRSCHLAHDHREKHRPSGRPLGIKMPDAYREKMREINHQTHSSEEYRRAASIRSMAQWDERGRTTQPNFCQQCGQQLKPRQQYARARFCSAACHYAFRTGKPRTGY